jgi:hypothetical protein
MPDTPMYKVSRNVRVKDFFDVLRIVHVVMRPILPMISVNHSALSPLDVILVGSEPGVESGYSVMLPPEVIRPILLPSSSVNQRVFPGPWVISAGAAPGVGMKNSLNVARTCLEPVRVCEACEAAPPAHPIVTSMTAIQTIEIRPDLSQRDINGRRTTFLHHVWLISVTSCCRVVSSTGPTTTERIMP